MPQLTTAILIDRLGPPESLVERQVPLRDPGPDEVHLEVHAAGVNFADLAMRVGLYGTVPPRPFSPGFEVAGVVRRVGGAVRDFAPGDRAVALLRSGGYARDVVVGTDQVFPYPDSLSPTEAAAVPVAFLTGWVCLFEAARARAGETVLVLGAGGGVGTAAVQLARRHGLRAIGTAGDDRKRRYVIDTLGAAACFDSRGDWAGAVERMVGPRGIDVALDPVGGTATAACRRLLAPLGRLVFYGLSQAMPGERRNWPAALRGWLRTPRFHPLSLVVPNLGVLGVHLLHLHGKETLLRPALRQIFHDITEGLLHPVLDRTFPLTGEGAAAAHHHLHARGNLGKVVLTTPQPPPAPPGRESLKGPADSDLDRALETVKPLERAPPSRPGNADQSDRQAERPGPDRARGRALVAEGGVFQGAQSRTGTGPQR